MYALKNHTCMRLTESHMYLTESHVDAFIRMTCGCIYQNHTCMHLTELHMHAFNRIASMYLTESRMYAFNRITHACI